MERLTMHSQDQPGIWVLLLGLALMSWGVLLLVKPDLLQPGNPIYHWIYRRWYADLRDVSPKELNHHQLRLYAGGPILVGILIVIGWLFLNFANVRVR